MNITEVLIMVVIMGGMTTGLYLFYTGFGAPLGVASAANFTVINDTSGIATQATAINDKLKDITGNFDITSIFDLGGLVIFKVIPLILSFTSVIGNTVLGLPNLVPQLPTWFTLSLNVAAIIFVIFGIIKIATRNSEA